MNRTTIQLTGRQLYNLNRIRTYGSHTVNSRAWGKLAELGLINRSQTGATTTKLGDEVCEAFRSELYSGYMKFSAVYRFGSSETFIKY